MAAVADTEGVTTNKETRMIPLDTNLRAARMLEAGRVTVTFTSEGTGQHITLTAKARAPKEDGGRWANCPLDEAKVIFIEVPGADGAWADKVGKVTRARGFTADRNADPARTWCAQKLLAWLGGAELPAGLTAQEEERCGRCGRALTDPVSIQRGIGPECYGRSTGSKHQTKTRPVAPAADASRLADATVAAEEREMQRIEAEGDREQTFRDEAAKHLARTRMERPTNGDGKDKSGVEFGYGDWQARAKVRKQRTEKAPARTPSSAFADQMTELPGTTFEDIFRDRAAEMGIELR